VRSTALLCYQITGNMAATSTRSSISCLRCMPVFNHVNITQLDVVRSAPRKFPPYHLLQNPFRGSVGNRSASTLTGSHVYEKPFRKKTRSWTTTRVALAVAATGTLTYLLGVNQPFAQTGGKTATLLGLRTPKYGNKEDMENVCIAAFQCVDSHECLSALPAKYPAELSLIVFFQLGTPGDINSARPRLHQ
jgi:hypothetical protein